MNQSRLLLRFSARRNESAFGENRTLRLPSVDTAIAHYTPPMRFTIVGSGAVGGYYGAKLARAGHDVTFIARGAHLDAMRRGGLAVKSPLGDFSVRARAESDPADAPAADAVIYAVKAYSNGEALGLLERAVRGGAVALTLQNGVDSAEEVARVLGEEKVIGGSTYIATAVAAPGVIEQTGTHRRIVFGEVFGDTARISPRVQALHEAFASSDIVSEAVADAHVPIWEKFCYLAPFAAFTGAARLPIGPLWGDPTIRQTIRRIRGRSRKRRAGRGRARARGNGGAGGRLHRRDSRRHAFVAPHRPAAGQAD